MLLLASFSVLFRNCYAEVKVKIALTNFSFDLSFSLGCFRPGFCHRWSYRHQAWSPTREILVEVLQFVLCHLFWLFLPELCLPQVHSQYTVGLKHKLVKSLCWEIVNTNWCQLALGLLFLEFFFDFFGIFYYSGQHLVAMLEYLYSKFNGTSLAIKGIIPDCDIP